MTDRVPCQRRRSTDPATPNDQYYLLERKLFSSITRAIEQYIGGAVLDLGCGNKPYRGWIRPRSSLYVGTDIVQSDEQMVDVLASVYRLPFPDGAFNGVLCTEVLEHTERPHDVLSEVARVLAPDGVAIVTSPQYFAYHEAPFDFYRYTTFGLRYLAESNGFEVIAASHNGGNWAILGVTIISMLPRGMVFMGILRRCINRVCAYFDDRFPTQDNAMGQFLALRKKR